MEEGCSTGSLDLQDEPSTVIMACCYHGSTLGVATFYQDSGEVLSQKYDEDCFNPVHV